MELKAGWNVRCRSNKASVGKVRTSQGLKESRYGCAGRRGGAYLIELLRASGLVLSTMKK